MEKLSREFYRRDALIVAKELLGNLIVKKVGNDILVAKIVEVEAYRGTIDKAAHSYSGKATNRTKIMYGDGGFAYVYLIYGMYYCMNIVASTIDNPEAILIRAVEPIDGIDIMSKLRYGKDFNDITKKQKINLTNGPGKLCIALNITKEDNGVDMYGEDFYILDNEKKDFTIETSKRINIDYSEEAKDFDWRFFIKDNIYVSKG
ncbi:DNA-3-methyladenine glycosylase [Clostridium algidicarnis]|uniref:Putative 3-methyladenine DNA glycosylase n=2 Tax=Clostridium algidicarnis TaxID=37659 RepID=A0A2S6FVK9_9CLOT|nr:DNA-3-methyladenine glycosylase [Clostridium algidicarnis]MBU3194362.1 DNA-3-methyladenine glycosylase [Clostridium algidicarnis]MBU3206374.1 DNA-3-methyladenine glycosylase [Clostridium algidicarnis]MBU3220021.1 DNA-3-methyladenine glycosylase [Clostridium algidicarnis]MCB2287070.1 DNA-3-methyladenine glycosylase [Clostridium algidicarnis]PPK46351.1 DNA-3-methyladenine glycosylase [Clostridium algidicarnis DSM 15099]